MSKTVTGENNILEGKKARKMKEKGKGEKRENSCHSSTTYGRKRKKKQQENIREILEKIRYIAGVWTLK